jgi:hypothetical protein
MRRFTAQVDVKAVTQLPAEVTQSVQVSGEVDADRQPTLITAKSPTQPRAEEIDPGLCHERHCDIEAAGSLESHFQSRAERLLWIGIGKSDRCRYG